MGRYPPRTLDEDGEPEPQLIHLLCETCGQRWQYKCTSGAVRSRIGQFALAHDHRDPFLKPVPGKKT